MHPSSTIEYTPDYLEIRGKQKHVAAITIRSPRIKGCIAQTPYLDASGPIIKGKIVPPVPPIDIAKPIALTWMRLGSNLAVTVMAPGNMGPRKTPKKTTAMAEAMKLGTSQKMSCMATAKAR